MTYHQGFGENPIEIIDVEPELNEDLKKHFPGVRRGFIRVGPKGYFYNKGLKRDLKDIHSLPLKPTDTFLVSFPRTGTTLTQELVWLIQNDLNYDKAKIIPLDDRYVFLEIHSMMEMEVSENEPNFVVLRKMISEFVTTSGVELFNKMPSPRFAKSHLPLSLLPPTLLDKCKVVYVTRDVRDVVVSFYHFHKLSKTFKYSADFKTFWNLFMKNQVLWAPFFEHVKEAWNQRHHPNMLLLFYEDLLKDLPKSVRRVADFFGKKYDDEQFARLCDHLDFKNFQNNKSVNLEKLTEVGLFQKGDKFIRKGKSGGWCEYFDEELKAQAERWIQENLKDTDLRFPGHD